MDGCLPMNSALNEKSTQSNKLLTLGEAARLLKISDTSLRRYATQGKIQSTRTDLGYRLFSQKDVEEFRVQLNTEKEEYRKKLAQLSVQKVQPLKPTKKLKSIYIRNALAGVAGVLTFFIISLVLLQNIPLTNSIGGIKTAVANTDKLIKSKISFLNKPKAAATQSEDVLGATDINANWVFKINRPTFLQEQVEVEKDINVSGALTVAQLSTLAGGIVTNNQNANLGVGTLIGGIINLTGPAAINNLTAIDTQSETSLEGFLDLDGDITSTGLNETEVNALRG